MEFVNNRRVFFGTDVYKQIPMILNQQKVRKEFLTVYNAEAHCVQMVREALSAHDIEQVLFDKVLSEPNLALVDGAAALCRETGCDCVLAIGGGSVIDSAKAIGYGVMKAAVRIIS